MGVIEQENIKYAVLQGVRGTGLGTCDFKDIKKDTVKEEWVETLRLVRKPKWLRKD